MENLIYRCILTAGGALWAAIEPQLHFVLICLFAMLLDCLSAWHLNRRVRRRYGAKVADGKFKSASFGKVFVNIIKVMSMLCLAGLLQRYVFEDLPIRLSNIVAGAVCFWQIWSILENESSCNNAKWAKIAQRIMIDKTERHFNIDLSELKEAHDRASQQDTENTKEADKETNN